MLSKGDSAVVELPVKDFYKDLSRRPIPSNVDSTMDVRYQFRIREIMDREAFMVYEQEMVRQFQERQLGKDTIRIDAYLSEKGISAAKHESGIRYVITAPGAGEKAKSGQTAQVHYAGYLLTGEYFDTSYKTVAEAKGMFNPMQSYEPYPVTIDQSNVIQGWHEALKMLSKGSKGTFYIPSTLAYGPRQRDNVIKPNSILVFDLEMVDLK
jgi:FKBP-type peptidyl-prolyl cis-trans isomerase